MPNYGAWTGAAEGLGNFAQAFQAAQAAKAAQEDKASQREFQNWLMMQNLGMKGQAAEMAAKREERAAQKADRLSPATVGTLSEKQAGVVQLQDLAQKLPEYKDIMGPVKSRALSAAAVIGLNTPETEKYRRFDSFMRDVRQAYGKAREGGVLRREDEYKYEKIVGDPNMTYAQAQEVLNMLQERSRQSYEKELENYKAAGYTVPRQFQTPRVEVPATGSTVPAPQAPGGKKFKILSVE